MTLYWWTHWFWITIFTIFCSLQHIHTVGSYPLNPPYGTKDYSKEKPLKFPLAAQTDIDDLFSTDDMILSNIFRNSKIVRHKDQLQKIGGSISSSSSSSSSSSAKNKDNVVMPPIPQPSALGEIHLQEPNKSINESNASTVPANVDDKIFRTKVEDVKLVNNNRSTILISKQSSTEIVSSESEANDSMARSAKPIGIINNATINDDNNNSTESFEESPPNNIQSIPPPSQESSASSLHSSSLLPSLPSSSSTILDPPNESSNSNSQHHEPFPFANITTQEEIIRAEIARQLDGERARKSKVLAEYRQELKFNFSADSKNLLARSATISLDDFQQQEQDESNISSEALSIQRAYVLDAGVISGICFAVVGLFSGVAMAGVVLYRRRYLNKPQALSEPDSSGYIDDSTIRDNSDEMYSLDNDSFLNSLEAMTIQNYWTDTVKHTKL